ncbi:hypothetical protein [Escherichia coli]
MLTEGVKRNPFCVILLDELKRLILMLLNFLPSV